MNKAVVVLGMHRSGTSAMAGFLNILGVDFGSADKLVMPEQGINPKGYWEHREMIMLNDQAMSILGSSWDDFRPFPDGWLHHEGMISIKEQIKDILQRDFLKTKMWGMKDPRLCKLLPLWEEIFSETGVSPHYVIVVRHPLEVAKSLNKRDKISEEKAYLLWLSYMLSAEEYTSDKMRTFITYDGLLHDWRQVARKISADLDLSCQLNSSVTEQADKFLSSDLRHSHAGTEPLDDEKGAWANEVYCMMQKLSRHGDNVEERKNMLAHRERYLMALRLFTGLMFQKGSVCEELSCLRTKFSDLSVSFDAQQRAYDDTRNAYEETRKVNVDTMKACGDISKAYEDTRKACEDTSKAYEDTRKAYEDTRKAYEDTRKAYEDTRKAYEDQCTRIVDMEKELEKIHGTVFGKLYRQSQKNTIFGKLYGLSQKVNIFRISGVLLCTVFSGVVACTPMDDGIPSSGKKLILPSGTASVEEMVRHERAYPPPKPEKPRVIPIMPITEHDMGLLPPKTGKVK